MTKKRLLTSLLVTSSLILVGCNKQQPLTEVEQASELGLTIEEYREQKQAGAKMNMNVKEHISMDEDEKESDM